MNSPRKHISRIREQLKTEGDYLRRARLPKRMKIAMIISNALDNRNWNDKELADRLDKYSSQVSKWLKGDHNFTIDTLSDIEEILGINLLNFDKYLVTEIESKPRQYHTGSSTSVDYTKNNNTLTAVLPSAGMKREASAQIALPNSAKESKILQYG